MISLELNKLEHMAEKQNVLWIKEEERRHWDHIRGKLGLKTNWRGEKHQIINIDGEIMCDYFIYKHF